MLIELSVENYRSISERQTLRLVASKHRSDAEGTPAISAPGFSHKLLTSLVIYGANASGKSNLLRAFVDVVTSVRHSATHSDHEIQPFRLDPRYEDEPTRFELTFLKDGARYQYGFALSAEKVHEEWLIAYPGRAPQLWFERRVGAEPKFGSHLKGEKKRIYTLTRPDALYLSVAAQLNHDQLGGIHKWITSRLRVVQARYLSPLATADAISSHEHLGSDVTKLLKAADLGIEGVIVRRHNKLPEKAAGPAAQTGMLYQMGKEDFLEIKTLHSRPDGSKIELDMAGDESDGTQRYFSMLEPVVSCLGGGGVLAVDELDDSLHPLLVRRIVSWFHDPKINKTGAQLIFNTHDTTLLDLALFRRDQIWFTEKDTTGATRLYSLLEFSPRKQEALQKGYLEGRYGAIPFLGEPGFMPASDRTKDEK
ncbi:MAG: ATP-binding protein [Polyangiaceae bacterium]